MLRPIIISGFLVDFRVNDYKKTRPRQHQDENYKPAMRVPLADAP